MSLPSLLTRTDVTAVKLYQNYILAGIGSTINIFQRKTSTLLCKAQGLHGQKIYGFIPTNFNGRILVYGGKQFTVISIDQQTESDRNQSNILKRCFEPVICDDWIHSVVWTDVDIITILTAHNVVQKWNTSNQTLISQDISRDNSILYSGFLLPLADGVLVMAGTVFSEVIIHKSGDKIPLHHLRGHKGVIFSISCDPQQALIVTTSDDRSVRIWASNVLPKHSSNTTEYWKSLNFICKHELYGHSARVMRNCLTSNNIISVGEDSAICYWDYDGNLIKKIVAHHNGCIWSIDADSNNLVTGGGDCGIALHPLSIKDGINNVINLDVRNPKKVVFTARNNLVILNENDVLIYYDLITKNINLLKMQHTSTYKLLTISACKQIIAIADMDGKLDVFVENCKDEPKLINIFDTTLQIGKVLSMQWAGNRHLVLCSDNGRIIILASNSNTIEIYENFVLPSCKERWLTSCDVNKTSNIFIVGDRCGNVHIYVQGKSDPVKSFSKIHGRYGPTSINIKDNEFFTTGRDGSIKYFYYDINSQIFKYMGSKDLDFQWIEKFLDKCEKFICGFQERVFVVYNIRDNSKVIEVPCGGGHRSWDAIRFVNKMNNEYSEIIKFVYFKNSKIHLKTFPIRDISSINLINGSHAKEINCLKAYKCLLDTADTFYCSGGEDTTLRISRVDKNLIFEDEIVFKHLSSVRTLKLHNINDNNLLLISAGGRAQINIRNISFCKMDDNVKLKSQELVNYQIKGTDKERKGNQTWRNCTVDFDPETRIMDLDVLQEENVFTIFCGCSDASVRVFEYNHDAVFRSIKELKYHKTCVLKTHCYKISNSNLLITATSRGDVAFWDIDGIKNSSTVNPIFVTKTNISGINSLDVTVIHNNYSLLATAGDDNTIHLVLLEIPEQDNLSSMTIRHQLSLEKYHSSQITGLRFVDNLMITASIDQRITLFEWDVDGSVICEFLTQTCSDIADIQGIDIVQNLSDSIIVCVFGKGMEVVELKKFK